LFQPGTQQERAGRTLARLLGFPAYETRLWRWANIQDSNIDIDLTEAFNAQMARIYKWANKKERERERE
jgi:ribosomal protein L37E